MAYQVAFSPSARRDLRDVVRYISFDSPERALSFGQFLVSQTKRLADFPELGRIVPEFGNERLREIVAPTASSTGSITPIVALISCVSGMEPAERPKSPNERACFE